MLYEYTETTTCFLQLSDVYKTEWKCVPCGADKTSQPSEILLPHRVTCFQIQSISVPIGKPNPTCPACPQLWCPARDRATVPATSLPAQPLPPLRVRYAFQILNGSPCLALIDSESPVFQAKVQALKVSDQRPALVINHRSAGHCLECECSVQ